MIIPKTKEKEETNGITEEPEIDSRNPMVASLRLLPRNNEEISNPVHDCSRSPDIRLYVYPTIHQYLPTATDDCQTSNVLGIPLIARLGV